MPIGIYNHKETKTPIYTKERNNKISKSHKGKIQSEEHKKNRSSALIGRFAGELHWNWKGGITPERKKLYFNKEYKLWRKAVFERDDYTCIWCGYKGNKLNADHIKPWAYFPELRFAIDNGRTLCIDCHKTTNTWGVHK